MLVLVSTRALVDQVCVLLRALVLLELTFSCFRPRISLRRQSPLFGALLLCLCFTLQLLCGFTRLLS
jgi:hypothetical protein